VARETDRSPDVVGKYCQQFNKVKWCVENEMGKEEIRIVETSPQLMVKLTDKKVKWAVNQVINKGESTEVGGILTLLLIRLRGTD
jgi:hypothetical protein